MGALGPLQHQSRTVIQPGVEGGFSFSTSGVTAHAHVYVACMQHKHARMRAKRMLACYLNCYLNWPSDARLIKSRAPIQPTPCACAARWVVLSTTNHSARARKHPRTHTGLLLLGSWPPVGVSLASVDEYAISSYFQVQQARADGPPAAQCKQRTAPGPKHQRKTNC